MKEPIILTDSYGDTFSLEDNVLIDGVYYACCTFDTDDDVVALTHGQVKELGLCIKELMALEGDTL
jgi:hypothetical protein